MEVNKTNKNDIKTVLSLYKDASHRLHVQGIDQWQNNYPNIDTLTNDIKLGESFVITDNNKVIATCSISKRIEETYNTIDGSWLNDEPYIVIHRITSNDHYKGCTSLFIDYIKKEYQQYKNIRIDTHKDNLIMKGWLNKHHFVYTGTIYLLDGDSRSAYQLTY